MKTTPYTRKASVQWSPLFGRSSNVDRLTQPVQTYLVSLGVLISLYWISMVAYHNKFATEPLASEISSNSSHRSKIRENGTSIATEVAQHLESLTIVSMNIAACQPSQLAPRHWTPQMSTDAVRTEILKSEPDIIALQECPGGADWAKKTFGGHYKLMGAKS